VTFRFRSEVLGGQNDVLKRLVSLQFADIIDKKGYNFKGHLVEGTQNTSKKD